MLRRVLLSNITCMNSSKLPAILAGVEGHPLEDIRISDVVLEQAGGGDAALAASEPEEKANAYPEPEMFGPLPATGLFARHVKNLEVSNFAVEVRATDARAAFWLGDVTGADFFRVRVPEGAAVFELRNCTGFRSFGSARLEDVKLPNADRKTI